MPKSRPRKKGAAGTKSSQGPTVWKTLSSGRAVLAGFVLAVLVFYYRPLFGPNSSIQWDAVDVHYSAQKYFADNLLSGKLPFWSPFVFSGMPFLADPQTGAFYPLNWPFFLIGITPRAIQWEIALHCLLALAGGYLLGRDVLKTRAGALFAAIFFAFSGYFAAHSSHVGMFQAAALLPWLLWTAQRAAQSARWLPAACIVSGCIVLAGHFQTALYCFFAMALFLAADVAVRRAGWRRALLALAVSCAAAGALSCVMTLPGLELTAQSERASADYRRDPGASLVPGALLTLVSPDRYGVSEGAKYTGPQDVTQFYFYQGILLLPLALYGALASRRRLYALALAVPAIWYAFGPPAGLYRLLAWLPGFRSVRAPVHMWFVAALGLALLAGAGIDALRVRFRAPWIAAALLLIAAADLFYWNMDHNSLTYARASFQDLYGSLEERFRAVAAPVARDPLHRLYAPFNSSGFGPLNGSLDNRIEVTFGYNPLALSRYARYLEAAKGNPKLLDSLAVTAQLDLASGTFKPNAGALPRVWAPAAVSAASSKEEAAARLANLDPAREAVVERLPAATGAATVRIVNYEGDFYRVRYEAQGPALLRIAVPYFPGWRAEVDGREAQVAPVDLALTGVVVPAGSHELELRFHSTWFALGAAASAISWLAVLAWLAWSFKPTKPTAA